MKKYIKITATTIILIVMLIGIKVQAQNLPITFKTKVSLSVKDKPTMNGNVVFTIPKKKTLTVFEYVGESYYKIIFKEDTGFVYGGIFPKIEPLNQIIEANKVKEKEIRESKQYKELIEKYGVDNAWNISNNYIVNGMTREMVKKSLGRSDDWTSSNDGYYSDTYYNFKGLYYSITYKDDVVVRVYKTTGIKD